MATGTAAGNLAQETMSYAALAGIYAIIGVVALLPAKYTDNAVKAQRSYRKAAKAADVASSKKFEEKQQGKKKHKQGAFQKGFLGAGEVMEKPAEIDMLDAFLPGPPGKDAPKIPNSLASLTMLLPVVFLFSAVVVGFFPSLVSLPWTHLLTVVLLWLKWAWGYPAVWQPYSKGKGKGAKKKAPPGKTVGGVDKDSVFSDTSSDDGDNDEEEEVYYAMKKPAAEGTGDEPVAEDEKDVRFHCDFIAILGPFVFSFCRVDRVLRGLVGGRGGGVDVEAGERAASDR